PRDSARLLHRSLDASGRIRARDDHARERRAIDDRRCNPGRRTDEAVRQGDGARWDQSRGSRANGFRASRAERRGQDDGHRILSTILEPDGGHAAVLGLDVVREAKAVRRQIGLAGQYATVDANLSGRENSGQRSPFSKLSTVSVITPTANGRVL